jgi:HK97 family phage portal protein
VTILQRIGAALKGWNMGEAYIRGATPIPYGGWDAAVRVEGATGPVWSNSAVMVCAAWLSDAIQEARPVVVNGPDADSPRVDVSPFTLFVDRPNWSYGWSDLVGATAFALGIDGNAYWHLHPEDGRIYAEWKSPGCVQPIAERGRERYGPAQYRIDGRIVDPEAVLHFRTGIDPGQPLLGLSRLKSAMREVMTDSEATVYTNAILRNPAQGTLVSLKGDGPPLSPDEQAVLKRLLSDSMGGVNRHGVGVASHPLDLQRVGYSPDQMSIRDTRKTPEERICAAFKLSPMVVGLGAGLDRSTYSNMEEARSAAYESAVAPLWRLIAATLTGRFLPAIGEPPGHRIEFDTSEVAGLQETEDSLYRRVGSAYVQGWLKRGEAREAVGFDAGPEDDVYAERGNDLARAETVAKLLDLGVDPATAASLSGYDAESARSLARRDWIPVDQ